MKQRKFKNKALWKERISRALTKRKGPSTPPAAKSRRTRKPGLTKAEKLKLRQDKAAALKERNRAKSQEKRDNLKDKKLGLEVNLLELQLRDRKPKGSGLGAKVAGGLVGVGALAGGGVFAASKINQKLKDSRQELSDLPGAVYEGAKTTAGKAASEAGKRAKADTAIVKEYYGGNFKEAKVNFQEEIAKPASPLNPNSRASKAGRQVGKVYTRAVNKKNKDIATTQKFLSPVTTPVTTRIEDAKVGVSNFKSEANNPNPDRGTREYKIGSGAGKLFNKARARAKKDIAWRKNRFGFSSSNEFWLEFGRHKGLEDDDLLEFAAKKQSRRGKRSSKKSTGRRRKPLTAAHKAKISRALKQNGPTEEDKYFNNQKKLATIGTVVAMGSQAAQAYDSFRTGQITREAMKSSILDRRITSVGAGVGGVGVGVGSIGRAFGQRGLTPYQAERINIAKGKLGTQRKNAGSYRDMVDAVIRKGMKKKKP